MSGQTLALILIGLVLAALWLRELLLDFAEQRFAEDALGQAPHGDMPFIGADDLESILFHTGMNSGGAPNDHA